VPLQNANLYLGVFGQHEEMIGVDNRFFNNKTRKKLGEYAYVQGTGESMYDHGMIYLSIMIHELLTAYYYSQQNDLRMLPEEVYENKWQNQEPRFIGKAIDIFIEVTLSKLIERKNNTWNFHQLLQEAQLLNWDDILELKQTILDFRNNILFIKNNRDERYAHTSKDNRPNVLSTMAGDYRKFIIQAMSILDMFVDGVIPYTIIGKESTEIDLREFINK
jgi:hypothetical protein